MSCPGGALLPDPAVPSVTRSSRTQRHESMNRHIKREINSTVLQPRMF